MYYNSGGSHCWCAIIPPAKVIKNIDHQSKLALEIVDLAAVSQGIQSATPFAVQSCITWDQNYQKPPLQGLRERLYPYKTTTDTIPT